MSPDQHTGSLFVMPRRGSNREPTSKLTLAGAQHCVQDICPSADGVHRPSGEDQSDYGGLHYMYAAFEDGYRNPGKHDDRVAPATLAAYCRGTSLLYTK